MYFLFSCPQLLLLHCDNLSSITYLTGLTTVHPMELAMLRADLKSENWDIDTGENDEKAADMHKEDSLFAPQADAIAEAFAALSTSSGI
jgi:hypothetical protein